MQYNYTHLTRGENNSVQLKKNQNPITKPEPVNPQGSYKELLENIVFPHLKSLYLIAIATEIIIKWRSKMTTELPIRQKWLPIYLI